MSRQHVRIWRLCTTYLTQRLTPVGRSLSLIWLIAALQGSVSLDIPIYHIWSFTTVCFALAWMTSRFAVPNLQLTRRQPSPIVAGSPLTYEVDIKNCSRRAAYALSVMEMELPAGLTHAPHAHPAIITRLAPRANMTITLQLHGLTRGHHRLSGLYAVSDYPLGLLRGFSFHVQATDVTVYPAYAMPTTFRLPLRSAVTSINQGMVSVHSMAAPSPDIAFVREYRHGDHPRHLHWASWARTGMPTTKVYQEETGPCVGLILDTAIHNAHDLPALESVISVTAGIAAYLLGRGIHVECLATATLLHRLSNGAPTARFTELMNTLAGLTASASVEWSSVAARLLEQVPACNTIVLMVLDWSPQTAGFVAWLHHHGIGVRTLIIRQGPTSQPPPFTHDLSLLRPGNPWPQDKSLLPWRGP